jgi:hypothetical protein
MISFVPTLSVPNKPLALKGHATYWRAMAICLDKTIALSALSVLGVRDIITVTDDADRIN